MVFNAIISAFTSQTSMGKKPKGKTARHKYVIEKYHERSVTDRYFK